MRETLRAEGTEAQPYRYKLCVWWNEIAPLVPPNWVKVEGDAPRDFLIAVQRFPCPPGDVQAGVDHQIVKVSGMACRWPGYGIGGPNEEFDLTQFAPDWRMV